MAPIREPELSGPRNVRSDRCYDAIAQDSQYSYDAPLTDTAVMSHLVTSEGYEVLARGAKCHLCAAERERAAGTVMDGGAPTAFLPGSPARGGLAARGFVLRSPEASHSRLGDPATDGLSLAGATHRSRADARPLWPAHPTASPCPHALRTVVFLVDRQQSLTCEPFRGFASALHGALAARGEAEAADGVPAGGNVVVLGVRGVADVEAAAACGDCPPLQWASLVEGAAEAIRAVGAAVAWRGVHVVGHGDGAAKLLEMVAAGREGSSRFAFLLSHPASLTLLAPTLAKNSTPKIDTSWDDALRKNINVMSRRKLFFQSAWLTGKVAGQFALLKAAGIVAGDYDSSATGQRFWWDLCMRPAWRARVGEEAALADEHVTAHGVRDRRHLVGGGLWAVGETCRAVQEAAAAGVGPALRVIFAFWDARCGSETTAELMESVGEDCCEIVWRTGKSVENRVSGHRFAKKLADIACGVGASF